MKSLGQRRNPIRGIGTNVNGLKITRKERELRSLVIARKISFGFQSDEGLKTREVLMTVLGTLNKRYPHHVLNKLESFLNQYAPNHNIDPYQFLFNNTS